MKIRLLFLLLACSAYGVVLADDVNRSYYTTEAKNGDGVFSILRRYHLLNECNLTHFYEINNINGSKPLFRGKDYKLPVYIYKYNGKSIRSTIDDYDLEKAKRIKAFNEQLKNEGLRKMSIEASKILWVPYHEIFLYGRNSK